MDKTRKKYEELTIIDDFMFGKVMRDPGTQESCREDPTIRLEDGTEKIFLNTKGTNEAKLSSDDMDGELRSLLDYFESLVPQNAFTRELDEAVADARSHKEWRQEYMKLELMMMDSRSEGREEGLAEGRTEGEIKKLVDLVCRKLAKGKDSEAIAEDLEEDLKKVRCICDIAAKYAPDYDREKILQELLAYKTVDKTQVISARLNL